MTPETLSELQRVSVFNEITRNFEVEVVKLATNPPHDLFIEEIQAHVEQQKDPSAVTKEDFIAYCILVNYQRRMKNYEDEEKYIQAYRHIFAPGHPFFDHMDLLSKMDNLEVYAAKDVLELAERSCRQLSQNNGAVHAYCEVIALLHENNSGRIGIGDVPQDVLGHIWIRHWRLWMIFSGKSIIMPSITVPEAVFWLLKKDIRKPYRILQKPLPLKILPAGIIPSV